GHVDVVDADLEAGDDGQQDGDAYVLDRARVGVPGAGVEQRVVPGGGFELGGRRRLLGGDRAGGGFFLGHAWCSLVVVGDEVDDGEDDDPHDVDEVPVEPGDLDLEVLLGR